MKKGLLCVLLLSTLFSCIKHEDAYVEGDDSAKKKEEYDKGFPVKDIDPKQDWNLAEQFIVNVSVNYGGDGEYTIKIYSDNPRNADVKAYLLGEYTVKDGSTNALLVDGLSSFESVYVCCVDAANGYVMKEGTVKDGKTAVAFGAMSNRAVSKGVASRVAGDWKEFDAKDIYELVKPNGGIFRENHKPSDPSVMNSYELAPNGNFTVYAVYGESTNHDEYGYYYYDPQTDPLGANRQYQKLLETQGGVVDFLSYRKNGETEWTKWDFSPSSKNTDVIGKSEKIFSEPYTINVPSGYRMGFYVIGSWGIHWCSNKKFSGGLEISAVINHNGVPTYVGLEDNATFSGGSDFDCNDIIFYIDPNESEKLPDVVIPEEPVETESMSWIIACEDLGSVGDYDFNDVVFSVSHVSGEKTAVVTPLAAGGTLPAKILYGGKDIGEIHGLLGGNDTSTMINTSNWGKAGNPITITVGTDFTMSSSNMGGFSLKIGDGTATITAPGQGEAPQMICVPGNWAWPTERTSIVSAYSKFGEWGANYGISKDWWEKPTGSVIKHGN
ncbi:DUF4842 domain-containing protein [Phocaeicola sp.]